MDTIFANFLSRPGVRQPILTSYCDGKRVTCSGLSQWGSKFLGDEGYSAIDIIHYYYGSDMYINTAEAISGIPSSWPGYDPVSYTHLPSSALFLLLRRFRRAKQSLRHPFRIQILLQKFL